MLTDGVHVPRIKKLQSGLRAFHSRNFRLFFIGQSFSQVGIWLQQVAMGWLVYRLTESSILLGLVGFAAQIPTLIGTPFAGVLADRLDRRKMLLVTQVLFMIQALALAWLTFKGHIGIGTIIALSLMQGFITSVDWPTRQAFVPDMLEDRADLPNAIALNSMNLTLARLIGPALAGAMLAFTSEAVCFFLNGVSYVAAISALLLMRIRGASPLAVTQGNGWTQFKQGFSYAFGFRPIRAALLMIMAMSLFGMPYAVLMPVFARDILGGGSSVLGWLMGAPGIGALLGSLFVATRKTVVGSGRRMGVGATVFGIGLMIFALSRELWLSLCALSLVGFGMVTQLASCNTFLQTIVPADKRGRVMGFYTMAFLGVVPFGSLIAGSLARIFGAPATLFVGAIACLVAAAIFRVRLPHLRKMVHPIYVQIGLLPELGLQSAARLTSPPED